MPGWRSEPTGTYATPKLDPELEIRNDRGTAVVPTGLVFEATDSVLRHVSIWGFGDSAGSFDTNVKFGTNYGVDPDFTGSLVEFNVIGTGPASFTDPGAADRSGQKNLTIRENDNAIVRDNLIGFAGGVGVDFNSGSNSGTVLRNEIRGNGILSPSANPVGVWISGNVTGNLITDNASGCVQRAHSLDHLRRQHHYSERLGRYPPARNLGVRFAGHDSPQRHRRQCRQWRRGREHRHHDSDHAEQLLRQWDRDRVDRYRPARRR